MQDEVGPDSHHHFDVGRVAAAGQSAELRQPRKLVRKERRFVRAQRA